MVHELNPKHEPTSATMFADYWTPKEAAYVRQLQIEELQNHFNLTLSFDRGSTQAKRSVYTVHVTTPQRAVYSVLGAGGRLQHHDSSSVQSCCGLVVT